MTGISGQPNLLTVPEACAQLRISRWMLCRLINEQRLRTVKLGRRRFVTASALQALVDGSEAPLG